MPDDAEVVVWWATLDDLRDDHLEWLDGPERERSDRLARSEDRRRFALGSAMVRSLVARFDDVRAAEVSLDRTCRTCGAQHGPVTAPGRPWRCSISHSGPFAVVAVVAQDAAPMIGVDIETVVPPEWPDLLGQVLAPGEPAPGTADDFLAMWVRKEAALKATGEGLSRPMASVRLTDVHDLRLVDLDTRSLHTAQPSPGPIAAALAVGDDQLRVRWTRARL